MSAFKIHAQECASIFSTEPTLELLHENHDYPFAHEAGVFIAQDNTLFVTSNQFDDPKTGERTIRISKVCLPVDRASKSVVCEEIEAPEVPMANGGVNYRDGILFCAQGTLSEPGGLVWMDAKPPYPCSPLISSFHGRHFNSVNDVVVHSDGSIWFTDPIYGYEQGIRCKPQLPSQVYRFDPENKSIRAVADGFQRPNGICFSPDEKIVYVTDTDWIHGDGTTDDARVSHM
jgi:gluconolactonase